MPWWQAAEDAPQLQIDFRLDALRRVTGAHSLVSARATNLNTLSPSPLHFLSSYTARDARVVRYTDIARRLPP